MQEPKQSHVVRLSPELARRARARVERPNSPYVDFSELVSLAVENQLALDADETLTDSMSDHHVETHEALTTGTDIADMLLPPPDGIKVVSAMPAAVGSPFDFLSSRLNPVPVAARCLVNLAATEEGLEVEKFVRVACDVARELGLRLRAEDRRDGRRSSERRWTGWPAGKNAEKAVHRFRWAFLLQASGSGGAGPFVELGLGSVIDGKVFPTARGVALAQAPSALLGEAEGSVLSTEQQRILREALLEMPGERQEITLFLDAVRETGGAQRQVDGRIVDGHSGWSKNHAVSHRAAMLGRLRDVGIVTVEGRGPTAVISLLDEEFASEARLRATATPDATAAG